MLCGILVDVATGRPLSVPQRSVEKSESGPSSIGMGGRCELGDCLATSTTHAVDGRGNLDPSGSTAAYLANFRYHGARFAGGIRPAMPGQPKNPRTGANHVGNLEA